MNLNKLNMENNTNIADILRDCPTGTKLYSPVFGNVTLAYVDVADRFPIGVKFDRDLMAGFLPDGRYVDVSALPLRHHARLGQVLQARRRGLRP